jgi:hypothetical protein
MVVSIIKFYSLRGFLFYAREFHVGKKLMIKSLCYNIGLSVAVLLSNLICVS